MGRRLSQEIDNWYIEQVRDIILNLIAMDTLDSNNWYLEKVSNVLLNQIADGIDNWFLEQIRSI